MFYILLIIYTTIYVIFPLALIMDEISQMLLNETFHNATMVFSFLENTSIATDTINGTTLGNLTPSITPMNKPYPFMGLYLGIRALWSILAIVGNALTIFVVVKFQNLQTNNNILICSLAAADILGGMLGPVYIFHQTHFNHPIYVPSCLVEKVRK